MACQCIDLGKESKIRLHGIVSDELEELGSNCGAKLFENLILRLIMFFKSFSLTFDLTIPIYKILAKL